MSQESDGPVDAGDRRRLVAVAYRLLGTTGEAEDAVQETYARWFTMSEEQHAAIQSPQAWLTRVVCRICLDLLGTARARRESYVGEWLPEPLPAGHFLTAPGGLGGEDPLDRVALYSSVSSALLVVLEAMSPPERVAFVLHDVFELPFSEIGEVLGRSPAAARQLATSSRRRLASSRHRPVSRSEHDAVVTAFADACRAGNLLQLTAVLGPDVTLRSDGGGYVTAARKPIFGADRVARFLLGALAKQPSREIEQRETPDGLAFAMVSHKQVTGIANLNVQDGRVVDVWLQLNPNKLTQWHT